MLRAERLWLSCTKRASMPPAANFRSSQDSKKKPRASPKTFGRISTTSGIAVRSNSISHYPAARELEQVGAIASLRKRPGERLQLARIDIAGAEGDFFRATHL